MPDQHTCELEGAKMPACAAMGIVAAIAIWYLPAIDNFFAGDDFSWLFHGLKTIHHPIEFFEPLNAFLRYSELATFVIPLRVFGLSPVPVFAGLIAVHAVNGVLVALLITRLSKSRMAGVVGGLFWALDYRHAEVVLRPYAVADSLALLFGVASLLLLLRGRSTLACLMLIPGLFSKENAVVFPVLATLMVMWMGGRWLRRTVPMWVVAGCFTIAIAIVRQRAGSYLVFDSTVFSRFWECWLTYLGPDASWLKQEVLSGAPQLLPSWIAAAMLVPAVWLVWRLPTVYRYGVLWTTISMAPTVLLTFQTSRYAYLPLVGVALMVGAAVSQMHRRFRKHGPAAIVLWAAVVACGAVFAVGVRHEEEDYDRHGELHRLAAESLIRDVAPYLDRDPRNTVLFVTTSTLELAPSLFPARPWYMPENFKWVYRRPYGVLGLANTYGFVSYCTYKKEAPSLFVEVPREDLAARLESSSVQVIVHDVATNRFSLASLDRVEALRRRALEEDLHAALQPGFFDPTCAGDQGF